MEPLSLAQTQELLDIVEARDWDALEELIAIHGYDESDEPDLTYRKITVTYEHREIYTV